ncbi:MULTISPECIES: argininosuccinate synthase [Aliarcobacter]|jgi:argininosuccinate synthase|uniref:Argininosuccinate synthase n=6 Tax=Arcobacteraceae TaxID=2808963 RepID=A0AAU0P1R0_9BACT|nr:argininosuccinate synthase [Aliarcobacter cryaerophilus]WNL13258.1 argininosuccinate synthase [Arcobacter sp. AZ-2023]WPD02625.1 argininosuccinate synthase [Arcobacter sp. DSM 115972]WPD04642.1 argininosuccinate synthase [Arcobacter sp. DSM 115956]WPD06737.1 argininosuccinate synthase [Arcobacter sp. DSM 115955]WPD09743.1 argininosuccinate synthase [Arcobacter sp. DSM 115954]
MSKKDIKKVVLAYSGGLDTSIILKWLQDEYDAEVITFTADLGQGEEVEPARAKAIACGIKPENVYILDVKEEFVKDYVFPMFRANAIYEGEYLLGTSIARPLIAKKLVEIANEKGAQAVSHGATGKGNDQVRFELGALALNPDLKVIAPWREWELNSRESLLEYAKKHGIEISQKHVDENGNPKISPYSMDANLLHISYEGLHLENPAAEPEESMWLWTTSPEKAPDQAEIIEIEYKNGDPIALNGEKLSPANLLLALNKLGNKHGIGRVDIVENRYVGMKARGCYETPGGTIMLKAHRAIESLTLDREAAHLKDELMPRYAKLIYQGYWFSPEREMLQAAIDATQKNVEGKVRLKLYKGNVMVIGRESSKSLYDDAYSTFEKDEVYNQKDAEGFIRLNALRLVIAGKKQK